MAILDLPFRERPVLELLNIEGQQPRDVDRMYAGYGWARVPQIWLGTTGGGALERVDDALVLGLHSCDVGEELPSDVELEFELPDAPSVTVLLSDFLEHWLPRLPGASAIVLAMCNPYRATLVLPARPRTPIHYAMGDVESWADLDHGGRIELLADGSWARLPV